MLPKIVRPEELGHVPELSIRGMTRPDAWLVGICGRLVR